jgi:hypothetical protein
MMLPGARLETDARALLCLLALQVSGGCGGPGSSVGATPDQLVASFMEAAKHAAPVRIAGGMTVLSQCRATPWLTVRPGDEDRIWADVQALEIHVETGAIEIADEGLNIAINDHVDEITDVAEEQILMARPWRGEARIECGDRSTDDISNVVVSFARLNEFSDAGHDIDDAYEMLSKNVDDHGLLPADDDDISEKDHCRSGDDFCPVGMQPLE